MSSLRTIERWPCVAVVIVLSLVARTAWAAGPEAGTPLVFAAGRASGNYSALASALAAELAGKGGTLRIRETEGSYDNAELLRDREVDLALLQSDVAYLEHYNRRPFLALASVYTEPIHVIAYRGLDLQRISDLLPEEGPFVAAVGAPGSGSSAHALAVLDELDLRAGQILHVQQSADEAALGLRNRDVDLAFVTTAVPSRVVRELAEQRIISLLDIDRDIAQGLRRRNPFFVAAEIPYRAYGTGTRNVQTLGTRTLLVARPDLSAEDVSLVLDALYAAAGRADEETLPFLRDLSPRLALDELAIPAHPAARRYHAERASLLPRAFRALRQNAVLLILVGAVLLALFRLSRLAYFVHQFVLGRVLVSLVVVWLAGSVAMHLFERTRNSAFRSFGSSAIAILHYLFSGLESKYPVTLGGNVVAVVVLSLGVGVVTLFTATLVTLLVERALNIKTLRSKPFPFLELSGHTVIAGWSERTKRIVRQLRSPDLSTRPTVVVIAPQASATKVEDRRNFHGVWVVEGDRTQAGVLAQADISTAARAVVLATEDAAGDPEDLESICCALAIERLAPQVHTIAETRTSIGAEHMTRFRADEIVDTETLAERLTSQCVITPGIAGVYDELLSFGTESQEIYILPLDRHLGGLCFREIRERLEACDAIPLGFWRRNEPSPRLNPPPADAGVPLRHGGGDRLVVMTDTPRAVTSLRARIKQRRSAMTRIRDEAGSTELAPPAGDLVPGAGDTDGATRRGSRIGICGWNEEARAVIRQLQESVTATHQDFEITVIDGPTTGDLSNECTRNVRFVFGDPTRSKVLENAGVEGLETLVVLADRVGSDARSLSDHRSLVICLAARQINPALHLIVQVLRSENQEHFERLAGVEIVSVEDLAEKLLAQAVISPGITTVFLELLTATEDSNEIYIVSVPPHWRGMPFSEIAAKIQDGAAPAVALGYRTTRTRDGCPVVVLNPRQRKSERTGVVDWRQQPLGKEDALVVMAYEEPTW